MKKGNKSNKGGPKENGGFTNKVIVANLLLDAEEKHGKSVSSMFTTMSNWAKRVEKSGTCISLALLYKWTLSVVMEIRHGTSDQNSTRKREPMHKVTFTLNLSLDLLMLSIV